MNKVRDTFLSIIHDEGYGKRAISSKDIISKTDELLKEDRLSPWHGFDAEKKKLILIEELNTEYFIMNGVYYTGNTCKVRNISDISDSILEKDKKSLLGLLEDKAALMDSVFLIDDLFEEIINNTDGFNLFNQDMYWRDVKVETFHKLLNDIEGFIMFDLNNNNYMYNKEKIKRNKDDITSHIINILKDSNPISMDDLYSEIRKNPYYFALLNIDTVDDPGKLNNERAVLKEIVRPNKLIRKKGGKLTLDDSLKKILSVQVKYDIGVDFNLLEELSNLLLINKNPMNLNSITKEFSEKYKNLDQNYIKREIESISEDLLYKKYCIHKFRIDDQELYIHKINCEYITNNSEYMLNYIRDLMEEFLKEKETSLIYPISNHLKKKLAKEFAGLSLSSILINDIIKRVVMEMLNRDLSIDNLRINLDGTSIEFMIDERVKTKIGTYYEKHPLTNSLQSHVKNELMMLRDKKSDNIRCIEELTLYDEDSLLNYYKYHRDVDKLIVDLQKLDTIS